jgi:hypothetical protein
MEAGMETTLEHYAELVRARVAGRRWICTADVAVPGVHMANRLMGLGAEAVLVVGVTRGAGLPDCEPGVDVIILGRTKVHTDFMAAIHASESRLQDLSPDVQARIDAFDPDGTARVIGPLFSQEPVVGGRRVLGSRPESWRALEDKIIIDALWDAAGVARAPAEVVAVADAVATAARLDQGDGTVWAADNTAGWHGGARGTRRVRDASEAAAAAAWAADRAEQVRIMPFLEGVPCSIHGIVVAGQALALRPMEMLVLRRVSDGAFHYAKAASFWDPDPADRADMQAFCRDVGRHLHESVGYRGVFTIDGVMTRDGFRPTELNPRFGAALMIVSRGAPCSLYLLHLLIAEGLELDWRPAEMERLLLALADETRVGGANAATDRAVEADDRGAFVLDAGGWRLAAEGEPPHATAVLGPSSWGGIAISTLVPEETPSGPPVGPRVAGLLNFLDAHWELGVGELEGAPDVRRGEPG